MRRVRASSDQTPVRRGVLGRDVAWIVGLTALALILRVAAVTIIGPRGGVFNDSTFYIASATSLASGHGYSINGFPTAQWPPGYSAVLSVVFRVFWPSHYLAQLTNAVIGALTVPVLFVLVRKLFTRRAAILAAAVLAVFPGLILWADVEVAETLYTFVVVVVFALLAFLPRRWWAAVVVGIAVGLATLVRGEGLLLLAAAVVVWWARRPREARWVPTLAAVAIIPVVFALVLLPWGLRNSKAMGQFVPLSTNSSTTLWSGHNAHANGDQNYAGPDLLGGLPRGGPQHELGEAKILRSEAIRYARTHPRRELELIPLKLLNLARGDAYVMDWVNAGAVGQHPVATEWINPLRVVSDAVFYPVLAATLLSIVLGGRRLWRHPVMRGVAVVFLLSLVLYGFVYYGNYRYRVPLTPLLLLVSSPLLAALADLRGRLAPRSGLGLSPAPTQTDLTTVADGGNEAEAS